MVNSLEPKSRTLQIDYAGNRQGKKGADSNWAKSGQCCSVVLHVVSQALSSGDRSLHVGQPSPMRRQVSTDRQACTVTGRNMASG